MHAPYRKTKISVIGAGGGFVVGLIHDICLTPSLHDCAISFMDVNPERLDISYALCTRYAREMGINLKIEKTLDRHTSLKNADFVITIALVDGARRLEEGWRAALKLGYKWPGSYHILYDEPFWLNFYQLRLFESITRDILELCPNAWHLLVSNPVLAATTYLQRKYPQCKMVGLCHGFSAVNEMPKVLGLAEGGLTCEIPGVNHFVWLTHCYHNGQDVFPMIDKWLEHDAEAYWAKKANDLDDAMRQSQTTIPLCGPMSPKSMDIYRKFGVIPIGDTANWTGASWPWWYHSSGEVENAWRVESEAPWFRYIETIKNTPKRYEKMLSDTSKKLAQQIKIGSGLTGEPMIPIVESISNDVPRSIIVNTLNCNEYVAGIPVDFEVEIPALVSKRGIQGIKTTGLPKPIIAHILRDRVAPVDMELAAYAQGSRELLVQLVLMDKWTQSLEHANDLLDAIFELPYHRELREYYK